MIANRPSSTRRPSAAARYTGSAVAVVMVLAAGLVPVGCEPGMRRIDREVNAMLLETSSGLGPMAMAPMIDGHPSAVPSVPGQLDPTAETIPTVNPPAGDLQFTAADAAEKETEQVISRLVEYTIPPTGSTEMDLSASLAFATRNSREFVFAEEEYVLAALRLLSEEHRWGPRFFDDVTATIGGDGDGGTFDTSLRVVNELAVTQRLPYGGSVGARALAAATENLHGQVSDGGTQTADLIFDASIPLLRGAGTVAREDLIRRRREIIYAARDFERFRREFLVDIAEEFLQLVVDKKSILNAQRQVESLQTLEQREVALYKEGRQPLFEAALAENATVQARDRLNLSAERYRLSVDRFKVRIGMQPEQPLVILDSNIGLPVPRVTMQDAVLAAMTFRLDLQNERDFVDDARRGVDNARNALLPDLNIDGFVAIPTDDNRDRAGLRFDGGDTSFEASVTFGLPLDREIERLNVRQAQIQLERSARAYDRERDAIAVEVRADVRVIDTALFSLEIQERGIEIAEQRIASLNADPAAAEARDFSDAEDSLLEARDARDRARRGLEVAILRFLLDSGQLRVEPDGFIRPLEGMEFSPGVAGPNP